MLLHQILGYLHSIEGCAFANLIAREPQSESAGISKVLTDATHIYIVAAGTFKWHGITPVSGIID